MPLLVSASVVLLVNFDSIRERERDLVDGFTIAAGERIRRSAVSSGAYGELLDKNRKSDSEGHRSRKDRSV
jgi:hypothetical protein